MVNKQSKAFLGIQDLTEGDIKIIKELAVWPFHKQRANTFNLGQKTGMSESYAGKIFRKLKNRGIIQKSVGGSYFLNKEVQRRIRAEFEDASVNTNKQDLLDEKSKPLSVEEADKLLNEQYEASINTIKELEKEEENKKKGKESRTQESD